MMIYDLMMIIEGFIADLQLIMMAKLVNIINIARFYGNGLTIASGFINHLT